jgi:hypothetical protein
MQNAGFCLAKQQNRRSYGMRIAGLNYGHLPDGMQKIGLVETVAFGRSFIREE